jgi:putative membrane protein
VKTLIKNTMVRISVTAALSLAGAGAAMAQSATTPAPAIETGAVMGSADTYFVTQTSQGTPFQVASGQLAETKGTTPAIKAYAQLMVSSHITVNNALLAILKTKPAVPPPTLLAAAYATTISTLQHEHGRRFDRDYLRGQLNYQKANVALYEYEVANGTDPDLKAFAQRVLPRVQDHLSRVLKLEGDKAK